MARRQLKHPPLVEVILEVKWALEPGSAPGTQIDPEYNLLLGRLYDRAKDDYPYRERLPTAAIPDEISGYTVKHRFRADQDRWPLIQVGPGILTVNDTERYSTFDGFRPRAASAVDKLFDAYPGRLEITSLLLRYIDAVQFDYRAQDLRSFLKEKMAVPISLPPKLVDELGLQPMPTDFVWRSSFRSDEPRGLATLGFATGVRDGRPALVWEQIFQSAQGDVPEMPAAFDKWLDAAHGIIDTWFFRLIEGELEKRFNHD